MEVSWHARDREAFLIAQLLRDSRLTVLYGDAGAGKTTLLKTGVLPLLRRRVGDRKLLKSGESRVVVPFPDRRGIGSPDQCAAEVAIFFDRWTGAPLAALQAQLFSALPIGCARMASPVRPLADPLAAWSKELRVRFLIIFDRFDEYLAAPLDRAGIREFADQFALVVREPLLPANFLISLRDEKLLLERFQQRIAGLGNASLRLPALPQRTARPEALQDQAVSHQVPITAAPASTAAEAPDIRRVEQSAAPDAAEIAPGAPPPSRGRWMPVPKWMVISVSLPALLVIGATVLKPTAQQVSRHPPVQAAADIESIAPMPSVTPPAAGVPVPSPPATSRAGPSQAKPSQASDAVRSRAESPQRRAMGQKSTLFGTAVPNQEMPGRVANGGPSIVQTAAPAPAAAPPQSQPSIVQTAAPVPVAAPSEPQPKTSPRPRPGFSFPHLMEDTSRNTHP